MSGPIAARLPGDRLHLQHGPIDLIIGADGDKDTAFAAAQARFETILTELMDEWPVLRSVPTQTLPQGEAARLMMHLSPGVQYSAAIANHAGAPLGKVRITSGDAIGGIATSGRHGRSFSLGIADSVTVLARSAAEADVAATLIGNAVDLPGHPAIKRTPANALSDMTDLGDQPVVTSVGPLSERDTLKALTAGMRRAQDYLAKGLISGASLHLNGETRTVNMPIGVLADA